MRKLKLEEIKKLSLGAVSVEETEGGISFHRFTAYERELYRKWNTGSYARTFTTAGVKLRFRTDSRMLALRVFVEKCMTRTYFSFDVFVNGSVLGYLDNFSELPITEEFVTKQYPMGQFSKTFTLGEGIKEVCIHFPWSVKVKLEELCLDKESYVEPVGYEKRMLLYGDSITHGADTMRPSNRYGARIAEALGAEELNKGIGGEGFFPELISRVKREKTDYIIVAYGTNDLGKDEESFRIRCGIFYELISTTFSNTPIFAITPIWIRGQEDNLERLEKYEQMAEAICQITKQMENVYLTDGADLVPHDEIYYGDRWVHPNDAGNEKFFENLYHKILEVIK